MVRRTALFLAVLVPGMLFAQKTTVTTQSSGAGVSVRGGGGGSHARGGQVVGHTGGHRGGPRGNLGAVAPHPGFGNINHPGLGYSPNTPGVGYPIYPGMQPLPTTVQPGIGPVSPRYGYGNRHYPGYGGGAYGHVHGHGCGHAGYGHSGYGYGYGGSVVIGVPVPVVVGGYAYSSNSTTTTSTYGYPAGYVDQYPAQYPGQQAPTVIIINPPAQSQGTDTVESDRPRHWPREAGQTSPARTEAPIYVTRAASSATPSTPGASVEAERPTAPITLLVMKDHSIFAVTKYWKEGDRLFYVTSYGAQNSVTLDLVDIEFSRRLNSERNVSFEL